MHISSLLRSKGITFGHESSRMDVQSQIYTKYNDDDGSTTPNNNNNAAAEQPHNSLFRGWHTSSRIYRVSRASGGKDRHSKVLTSKGLRDRRVRLSVSTAIQFYDLQDRLGYDQPSKAVEWLIKAAADSIAELPSLHGPFSDTPTHHLCDAKSGFNEQQKNLSASSTSDTSKGSLITRTDEVRVNQRAKARERARERAKESEHHAVNVCQRIRQTQTAANPIPSSSTFTELLTGGNQSRSSPMMDYFTNAGLISAPAACLFLRQMGSSMNSIPQGFHLTTGDHHQQYLSFGQQNLIPSGNDHQSPSGLAAGFNNRGTLQSNSPSPASSPLHHNLLQRYAVASTEGSSDVPAFFMTTNAASSSMDNINNQHHHFSTGLDGGLHLYYGDHKDKGKN